MLVASSLLAASAAHADPLEVTDAAPLERGHMYIAPSTIIGGSNGHAGVGLGVDLGIHVYEAIWLHAGVTGMDTSGGLFGGSGTFKSAHAGIELSTCRIGQHVCVYGGADLGTAHGYYEDSDWFSEDDYRMSYSYDGTVTVIRAGLDIGSKTLRWRPGFEATLGTANAAGITNSLLVRF